MRSIRVTRVAATALLVVAGGLVMFAIATATPTAKSAASVTIPLPARVQPAADPTPTTLAERVARAEAPPREIARRETRPIAVARPGPGATQLAQLSRDMQNAAPADIADLAPAAGPTATEAATPRPQHLSAVPARHEAEAPPAIVASPSAKGTVYVVIGSFLEAGNATRLVAEQNSIPTRILKAEVDGRLFHRVVLGPFPKGEATAELAQARAAGFDDAWRIGTGAALAAAEKAETKLS